VDSVHDRDAVLAAYGLSAQDIASLTALRTSSPPVLAGGLDMPPWDGARWSGRFVDLVTGAPALYDTRVACLWDDEALYVGIHSEEPFLRGRLTERDSLIWYDDDVELFIAGDDAYWELEVNQLGTVYEVLHVWADATREGRAWHAPAYDPRSRDARGFVGNGDPEHWDWDGLHPRGHRWSFLDWDLPGLRTGVSLAGTVGDDSDVDEGWDATIAVPWAGIAEVLAGPAGADGWRPQAGATLRCCFARFENLESSGRPVRPTTGWTLNRHGRYDIHVPEAFPIVTLSDEAAVSPPGR
jgi:hypothetical protein